MRWKLLNFYVAIAIIKYSDGTELPNEPNLTPVNVDTTALNDQHNLDIYTTKVTLITPTESDKPAIAVAHVRNDQKSNEILGDIMSEESTTTTKIPNISTSQEQEPGSSKSSESALTDLTDQVIVTENGPVVGHYLDESKQIRSYFDIPYGAITGLFTAPVKSSYWVEIHQASNHKKRCPQIGKPNTYVGDIDCLTLSIFAPANVGRAPVLFHIHDGQLQAGSGDPSIYGPDYLASKGIILVLPNYRLGPLGFLCLKNDVVPGNAGLKDLSMALEWTVKNIAAFGGDPSNIAVSGYGNAGALAGLLAISPKSRRFINKVITESGSVLAPWALDRDPVITATSLAESIRSDITGDIDLPTLMTAAKDLVIRPCVERGTNAFMNETPWEMLNNAKDINITFMIGTASFAGIHEALEHDAVSLISLNENFSHVLPEDLRFTDQFEKQAITDEIRKQYFKNEIITVEEMEELSLYYTDAFYLGPSIRYARSLVKSGATVFLYEFSFVGEMNRELGNLETTIKGAARGDIIGYVFTQAGELATQNSEEEMVIDLVTDLWVSFLHNGHPSADNVQWNKLEQVEETQEEHLVINLEPEVQKGLHLERLSTWSKIYRNYYIELETNLAPGLKPSLSSFIVVLVCFLTELID